MKIVKIIIFLLLLVTGCSQKNNVDPNDIENWDIDINTVESIKIKSIYGNKNEIYLDKDEINSFITTFNNINNSDIYEKYEDHIYMMYNSIIDVTTKNQLIQINFAPIGYIYHNEIDYISSLNLEFYDFMREIDEKYNLELENWSILSDNHGYYMPSEMNSIYCTSDKRINEVLEFLKIDNRVNNDIIILDLLNSKQNQYKINDIVEYEDIQIKIVEIKDEKVTVVLFSYNK